MARPLDWPQLETSVLAVLADGPRSAPELQDALDISQPSLSRLMSRLTRRVVAFGNARHRRYALRREQGPLPIPVFEVDRWGELCEAFVLEAIVPEGLVVVGARRVRAGVYRELPWFLRDLRPRGFLGRQVATDDVRRWGDVDVLEHLVGQVDLPGAWLFGEEAVVRRAARAEPPDLVEGDGRVAIYAARAEHDPIAGSSWIAGRHPKLLATRRESGSDVPVIVKYSSPRGRPAADRTADLLVAEHIALGVLRSAGHLAARTVLLEAGGRTFLEIERFDRPGRNGRRALASLRAIHGEHLSTEPTSASASTARLFEAGVVDETTHRAVRFREQVSEWIGGPELATDDVAFFLKGLVPRDLAPAFDVRPEAYAPGLGDVVPEIEPPVRVALPSNHDVASAAHEVAMSFWAQVVEDDRISSGFRAVALRARARLARVRPA